MRPRAIHLLAILPNPPQPETQRLINVFQMITATTASAAPSLGSAPMWRPANRREGGRRYGSIRLSSWYTTLMARMAHLARRTIGNVAPGLFQHEAPERVALSSASA